MDYIKENVIPFVPCNACRAKMVLAFPKTQIYLFATTIFQDRHVIGSFMPLDMIVSFEKDHPISTLLLELLREMLYITTKVHSN